MRHGYHAQQAPADARASSTASRCSCSRSCCASLAIDRPRDPQVDDEPGLSGRDRAQEDGREGHLHRDPVPRHGERDRVAHLGLGDRPSADRHRPRDRCCSFVRYGAYIVSVATIVVTLAVTHQLDRWFTHHRERYPLRLRQHPGQHHQARHPEQLRHGAVGELGARDGDQHPAVADHRGLRGDRADDPDRGAPPAREALGGRDRRPHRSGGRAHTARRQSRCRRPL